MLPTVVGDSLSLGAGADCCQGMAVVLPMDGDVAVKGWRWCCQGRGAVLRPLVAGAAVAGAAVADSPVLP